MSAFGVGEFSWIGGAPGGSIGYGFGYGMPVATMLYDEKQVAKDTAKAKTEDPIDRPNIWSIYGGPGSFPGFDEAPQLSLPIIWQMRRYAVIVLAFAITTAPILASPQTIEIVGDKEDALSIKMKDAAAEDGLLDLIQCGLAASMECLHFGYWLQELIWDRKNGRTVPIELRTVLPGECTIYCDKYRQFAGYQINTTNLDGYRDARYALLSVNNPHIHPLFGEPRNAYCREEWWRIRQSESTADRTERKASGIQFGLGVPSGASFTDANGKAIFPIDMAQTLVNSATQGNCFVYPLTPFNKDDIKRNPALADIPAVKVQQFDWGNIGPALLAHLARIDKLDMKVMQAWRRPTREAMEGSSGTKAEAGVHGQIGVTDSELVAADRMRECSKQIIDRWAVTNWGPDAIGRLRVVQSPLSDPQQEFLQQVAQQMLSGPSADPEMKSQVAPRKLLERVEMPMLDEEEAKAKFAAAQKQEADDKQQKIDAMKSSMNGNGKPPNGSPVNGDGKNRITALSGDIPDWLAPYAGGE